MQRYLFRTEGIDDRVGRMLSGTLYSQPVNLFFSVLSGGAAIGIAAWFSGLLALGWIAGAVTVVGAVRMASALLARRGGDRTRRWETVFEVGGVAYALLVGCAAVLSLLSNAPPDASC